MDPRLADVAVIDAVSPEPGWSASSGECRYITSIANRPLIRHVVDSLTANGISRIVVLARAPLQRAMGPVLGDVTAAALEFIDIDVRHPQVVPEGLREAVGDGPMLLHSGDCLFPADIRRLQERFHDDALDLAVLVRRRSGPSEPTHLLPRPRVQLPRHRPDGTALVVGPEAWGALQTFGSGAWSVPNVVSGLKTAGLRVGACEVGQHWCYSDRSEELLVANHMLLDAMQFESPSALACQNGNESVGRVSISPRARVLNSRLRGPALIGADAVVEDSFIGPYTAIGRGAVVVGAELDYTMVLADAEVRHPGYRLESSVIGQRATVRHNFGLPAGMHLRVGPDARVTLS